MPTQCTSVLKQMPAYAHGAPLCPEAGALFLAMHLKTTVSLQLLGVWWAPCLFLLSENHCQLATQP